jgi:hypothetical protein
MDVCLSRLYFGSFSIYKRKGRAFLQISLGIAQSDLERARGTVQTAPS